MAKFEPEAPTEDRSPSYVTVIGPVRDLLVGLMFLGIALLRLAPPFNTSTPTITGLLWITFIGVYGLYRVVRGIIKFGRD